MNMYFTYVILCYYDSKTSLMRAVVCQPLLFVIQRPINLNK